MLDYSVGLRAQCDILYVDTSLGAGLKITGVTYAVRTVPSPFLSDPLKWPWFSSGQGSSDCSPLR